jgi:hypothetical protein
MAAQVPGAGERQARRCPLRAVAQGHHRRGRALPADAGQPGPAAGGECLADRGHPRGPQPRGAPRDGGGRADRQPADPHRLRAVPAGRPGRGRGRGGAPAHPARSVGDRGGEPRRARRSPPAGPRRPVRRSRVPRRRPRASPTRGRRGRASRPSRPASPEAGPESALSASRRARHRAQDRAQDRALHRPAGHRVRGTRSGTAGPRRPARRAKPARAAKRGPFMRRGLGLYC